MMNNHDVDPLLLHAWLSARSIARGLPSPVADYGGFRVDTGSDAEIARWVFPKTVPGLKKLARSIDTPRYLLKLCDAADVLLAALPIGWELHAPSYFMQASGAHKERGLAKGYRIEAKRIGMVSEVRIWAE